MLKSIAIRILLPALCFGALANCGSGGGPGPREPEKLNSPARLTLSLGKVGVLSKVSAISLRKLVLTAVSEAQPADTVRDTSLVAGSEAQTVRRVLDLKPLVAWVVSARTLDQRDSVIHAGATPPFRVDPSDPSDTSEVALALASRFVMYQALFGSLPTSVAVPESPSRAGIGLNRLVLLIDGAVRADSTLPEGRYFERGQNVALQFDYVTPGAHTVALEAYGAMEGWSGRMFSGTATFTSVAGQDGTHPVTLQWVGPATGSAEVTVILGHIGKVTLVGGFNPML